MPSRKIVLAGGTGFIGSHLAHSLARRGDEVVVLTRGSSAPPGTRAVKWDGRSVQDWAKELDDSCAIVNLAGETIQQRWSVESKRRILQSRLDPVQAICEAVTKCASPPKHWINASAIGYYGDRGDQPLDENAPPGQGFLAETCVRWEQAVHDCPTPGTAKTVVRIGVVLGEAGALAPLRKLARLGLGGPAGSGDQYVSWIHVDDLANLMLWIMDQTAAPAVVNGTAPEPVTNREFMRTVRDAVHAPFGLPAPSFAVRLIGKTLGPDADLILTGARVLPNAALEGGCAFQFPRLRAALLDCGGPPP